MFGVSAQSHILCAHLKGLKIKNIVVNTLNDEIKFKEECWKKFSKEVVQFIKGCMNKNPEKRLDIKEVLIKKLREENLWIWNNIMYMILVKKVIILEKENF